jgi:ribosomal protein S17E
MKRLLFVQLLLVTLVACQPTDEERAQFIVSEARTLIDNGQWNEARILIDSLHATFPREVAQRRAAKALSDSIIYLEAQCTLAHVDTLLPPLLEQADQIIKRFKYEKNDKYESNGKYVHRLLATNSNSARNFIQAYVMDNRQTVVKSYYCGPKQMNQQAIIISVGEEQSLFRGSNYHFQEGNHYEIMTLDNENSLSLLKFIAAHTSTRVRVEGQGDTSARNWVYYLNDKEKEALTETYRLGAMMNDINRLERMKVIAAAQIERYSQK